MGIKNEMETNDVRDTTIQFGEWWCFKSRQMFVCSECGGESYEPRQNCPYCGIRMKCFIE